MSDTLTQTSFDKILVLLDRDRERAGAKYVELRERLVKFFEWRDCESAEELTDIVFDRVARKISEGEEIQNLSSYSAGVARLVAMEHLRKRERTVQIVEENPQINSLTTNEFEAEEETANQRIECLERCLTELTTEQQKLLIAYHDTDERTMIPTRKRLADELNISLNTLRIRVCRLKSKLEDCVRRCCDKSG